MLIVAESIFWTSLGIFLLRGKFITSKTPKLLGRLLYWIGIPLQILALARRSNFEGAALLPPAIAITVLLVGMGIALLCLPAINSFSDSWLYQKLVAFRASAWQPVSIVNPLTIESIEGKSDGLESDRASRASKGSFVLASMLGNTGFIGLAIAPALVSPTYWSWIVIYGVAHNVLGSYGLGVVLANYYSRSRHQCKWLKQLCHIFKIPSLWAFVIGWLSRDLAFPEAIESGIQTSSLFVVPSAFLLIGMQLSTIQKIDNWQTVLMSTAIKISILPVLAGLGLTLMGLSGDARLALVLMSGMPTAFANVILAEEYDLNRQIAASSILLSTLAFPLILPLWLILFK